MTMINIYTKGRCDKYNAKAILDEKGVTVLAGSKISNSEAKSFIPHIAALRADESCVSECILKKDLTFDSLSYAAAFVTGNISNGKRVWKLKDGTSVGSVMK